MTDGSITGQCLAFLHALAAGAAICALYYLIGLIGRRLSALIRDLVYILLASAAGVVFFLTACEAYIRIYHIAGLLAGMLIPERLRALYLRRRNKSK